jgi:hypothetical protein
VLFDLENIHVRRSPRIVALFRIFWRILNIKLWLCFFYYKVHPTSQFSLGVVSLHRLDVLDVNYLLINCIYKKMYIIIKFQPQIQITWRKSKNTHIVNRSHYKLDVRPIFTIEGVCVCKTNKKNLTGSHTIYLCSKINREEDHLILTERIAEDSVKKLMNKSTKYSKLVRWTWAGLRLTNSVAKDSASRASPTWWRSEGFHGQCSSFLFL